MAALSYKNPKLTVRFHYQQNAQPLPLRDELCYSNNENSLFRKYADLVTWFANTSFGKKILHIDEISQKITLLLPNGYHYQDGDEYVGVFYSRPVFANILYPILQELDISAVYMRDFEQTQQWFLFCLRLGNYPQDFPFINYATLTGYPDADPETTTVDGWARRDSVDETMATIRAGAGSTAVDTGSATDAAALLATSTTNNQFAQLLRSFFLFDTSSIGIRAVVTDATLSLFGSGKVNNLSGQASANSALFLVSATPASNTALVAADYSQVGGLEFGRSAIQSSWSTTGYNDITLNTNGLKNIVLNGISKFAGRYGWDISNTILGLTWGASSVQDLECNVADAAGTTNDPKLVANYTTTSTSTTTTTSTSTTTTSTSTSTTTSTTTTSTSTSTSTSTTTTSTSTTSTSSSTTQTSSSTTQTSTTTTLPLLGADIDYW